MTKKLPDSVKKWLETVFVYKEYGAGAYLLIGNPDGGDWDFADFESHLDAEAFLELLDWLRENEVARLAETNERQAAEIKHLEDALRKIISFAEEPPPQQTIDTLLQLRSVAIYALRDWERTRLEK